MVKYAAILVALIPTFIQECVSATVSPDTTPTAKKKADLTECRRCVGPTLSTCWQQTQMSVIWGHQKSNHVPYYLFIMIIHLGNMYYGVTDMFLT